MANEMIERVALEIRVNIPDGLNPTDQYGPVIPTKQHCLAAARAAIAAMREPTEQMIAAYRGPRGEAEYGLEKYHAKFIEDVMGALVDAALSNEG